MVRVATYSEGFVSEGSVSCSAPNQKCKHLSAWSVVGIVNDPTSLLLCWGLCTIILYVASALWDGVARNAVAVGMDRPSEPERRAMNELRDR